MALLTLTEPDRRRLRDAIGTLTTPLAHTTLEGWMGSVNAALGGLVGADSATIELPRSGGGALRHSNELSEGTMELFAAHFEPISRRYKLQLRAARVGVLTRRGYWAPLGEGFERSSFYRECLVPSGMYDGLSLSAGVGGLGAGRTDRAPIASVYLDRSSAPERPFGDREVEILRLLQPAFLAGAEVAARTRVQGAALPEILEGSGGAAVAVGFQGRVLHASAAHVCLMEAHAERDRERIATALQAVAFAARSGASGSEPFEGYPAPLGSPLGARVVTALGAFRLRGTVVPAGVFGCEPVVLVYLSASSGQPALDQAEERFETTGVRGRFDLSRREVEVALLLARRRTNAEVARELGISPHTARRHTERVLEKLGVASRTGVAAALNGAP